MPLTPLRFPGKLARRLAGYLLLFCALLSILLTASQLAIEYRRDLQTIDDQVAEIERIYLPSLIENLWVADRERLKTQLDGIIQLPDFALAEIRVDGKALMRSGQVLAGPGISRSFPLWRAHRGRQQHIGELVIAVSHEQVLQRTGQRLLFFFAANVLMAGLVALFIFWIFFRLIGRHIEQIAGHARRTTDLQSFVPVALERREPPGGDELSELVGALNGMQETLGWQQQDLLEQIRELSVKDAAIASSINAIGIVGLDGKLSYVNPAFVALWRMPRAEAAIGVSPMDLAENPADAREILASLQQIGYWHGEFRARLHDGNSALLQIAATMAVDGAGEPICMMASFVDITAARAAEQELSKSRALLSSLVSNMPAMVFLKGAGDLRFERLNRAGEQLLGYPESALLGHNDYDFFPREQADRFTAHDREVLRSGEAKDIPQEPILTRSGETRILHTRKIGIYDAAGVPVHLLGVSVDITEKIQADELLRRERDFANGLVTTAPMIVLLLDMSGVIEYANPYFEQLSGYRLDEIKGREWFSTFLPECDRERIRASFEQSAGVVPRRGHISPIITRGGAELQIDWYSRPMHDADGKLISVLATGQDVTARVAMERALSGSAESLREAQRVAQVGSWELDLRTGAVNWSDEIFRLFELDMTRFAATYEAFLGTIHPDDLDAVNQAYTESLETRSPSDITHRLRMSDGRIKWVRARCESEYDAAGEPLRSLGTLQDITVQVAAEEGLRESERRYQSLVSALTEGVIMLEHGGVITTANRAAQDILGLTRDQLRGLTPIDPRWRAVHLDGSLFPGSEHPGPVALRTGEPQFNVVHGIHKPDGSLIWISVSAVPIFHPGAATPYAAVVSFTDVTDLKQAEDELRRSNEALEQRVEARTVMLREAKEQAERASQAKSRFLSSMSHELRTPLNAILGYAQIMEMGSALKEGERASVHEIQQAGQHLLSLVNDILDLARIESGKVDFQIETVDLAMVLAECRAQNIQAAESRNIAYVQNRSCERYQVTIDHRRLRQGLNNLISNAIKYNRTNGSVTISCNAPSSGRVRISVVDTGTGIAADKQAQLFESFNRLGAEAGPIEGTGIGLVITRQMFEAMDGAIGVDSTPGVGSCFWLEMPGQQIAEQDPAAASAVAENAVAASAARPSRSAAVALAGAETPHGGSIRILVVEDYEPNQALLKLQMNKLGYAVDMAPNGAVALEMWLKGQYDLILTDINMPVMDGLALTQAVRQLDQARARHTPIVAITAAVVGSELQRCRDAGMDDVLAKPIALEDLQAVLARLTGAASRAQGLAPVPEQGAGNDEPVLDVGHVYRILGQVELERVRELAATFISSVTDGLTTLASGGNDASAVAREMHKQKSSARTVGALRYASHAEALEQLARAGERVSLETLRLALADFEAALARFAAPDLAAPIAALPRGRKVRVACRSVMIIDDDRVVLKQMKLLLAGIGVAEVLAAQNGRTALAIMQQRGERIEALVCDLDMPEMDGVQLIRQLHQTNFSGGLILMSGADEKVLSTVSDLAERQGLRVLGQAQKPVMPNQMAALLERLNASVIGKRLHGKVAEVSAQAIHEGIRNDEFAIWFQPKLDAISLRPIGVEALARWRRSDGKMVPPEMFIVAAERDGLIGELSQILVSKALLEGARLHDLGFPLTIAVNLSGRWLDDLNLPDFVLATVNMAGLKAGDVLFEVTETGVMEDLTTALDVLSRLRLKGFGLSIDDFGIGYSSFEQLGRIPFTEMKLDRSFVIKGNHDVAARAILESSMNMARKLGLATVAEGVETKADLDLVRTLGCDSIQGYLLAKPMPLADLLPWLMANQETAA